ncbi:hypothetical protein RB195_018135 [Necator americanus]|uniref:Uncharacterized protein n=1 Tax=Necator americanus TaxID=51031 RepID=A0ABR1C8C2_NECAM
MTDNILVTRTSVPPKNCIQVADKRLTADQNRPCTCPETQVDSGDGLTLSALPGPLYNTTVQVRPKACNQVTGRFNNASQEAWVRLHRTNLDETTQPLNAVFETGEELFLGTCDSREVGVFVNTSVGKKRKLTLSNHLPTRIGRLRTTLAIFFVYAPTSSYEGVKAFYMDLEKSYADDHTFYKFIVGDFDAKIAARKTPEELHIETHGIQWNEEGEKPSEFIMTTKTIHGNSQFQDPLRRTWESPDGGYHSVYPKRRGSREVQRTKSHNCQQLGSFSFFCRLLRRYRHGRHRRRI